MIKILCISQKQQKTIDISNIVKKNSSLKKSITELSWVYEFEIVKNKDFQDINVGDVIVVKYDGKEIFSGIVITTSTTFLKYKCVDFCWYFSKNEEVLQFENVEGPLVVKKIIEIFGGEVGKIDRCDTMVDTFYFGKGCGDIIREIIDNIEKLENKSFRFFYENGYFNFVLSKKNKYLNGDYQPLGYLKSVIDNYTFNALEYIKIPDYTSSIEDMYNFVKVYKTSGKEHIQVDEARDGKNVDYFGVMTKIVEVKDNDLNKGSVTAGNTLKKLNKITNKLNIEIDVLCQFINTGEVLKLNYSEFGINGVYEVVSLDYTFNHKNSFSCKLTLEEVLQ